MASSTISPRETPPPITLTTDFGLAAPYAGSMKGIILGILPDATIVDISHDVAPQNIRQAAYVLGAVTPYFPDGTVHVVVVDPGVGSERRPITVFTKQACFVGPDNGVFSRIYQQEEVTEIRQLSNTAYHLPVVSSTFHGRDIFAPVAAHIAAGVPPSAFGPTLSDPIIIHFPTPEQLPDGRIQGEIIYADEFGNLISNIPVKAPFDQGACTIEIAGVSITALNAAYSDVQSQELVALSSSTGYVEIAKRNGSAARHLSVGAGESLTVRPSL
jgi:S-adenosyl-L-methionine hydrolase (adenosine-forming)